MAKAAPILVDQGAITSGQVERNPTNETVEDGVERFR